MKTIDSRFNPNEKGIQLRRSRVEQALYRAERPTRIWDALGGTGVFADVIARHWTGVELIATELHLESAEEYRARNIPNTTVLQGDCLSYYDSGDIGYFDAVICDFNVFTILDLLPGSRKRGEFQRQLLNRAFNADPLWVLVEDTAYGKLHLNYRSYGLHRAEEYWEMLSTSFKLRFGYRIVCQSELRGGASLLRLEPER